MKKKPTKVNVEKREKKEPGFQYQSINVLDGSTVGWYASRDLALIDGHQNDIPVDVSYRSVRKARK